MNQSSNLEKNIRWHEQVSLIWRQLFLIHRMDLPRNCQNENVFVYRKMRGLWCGEWRRLWYAPHHQRRWISHPSWLAADPVPHQTRPLCSLTSGEWSASLILCPSNTSSIFFDIRRVFYGRVETFVAMYRVVYSPFKFTVFDIHVGNLSV